MTIGRRVVFLDRDGVVTVPRREAGKGFAARSLAELEFYPDAAASVQRLKTAGFDVVIVTNQPDIAAGLLAPEALDAMNEVVRERLVVDAIRTCPHSRSDDCPCRKPRPGLLLQEDGEQAVDFAESWLVGDRDSDIEAGLAVGCRTVFLDRGWTGETGAAAQAIASTMGEAVDTILLP